MMSKQDIISRTTLFQGVDKETLATFAARAHEKHYTKGQDIFSMGDRADAFFVILEGWVKLYRLSREGEEVIIHVFGPGESFAEAAVFNERQSYPVNAQAIDEQTTVIDIPRSFFVQKIQDDPQFALRILGAIASRQHYLVQQLEQVSARTAPQRIGTFILRFCKRKKESGNQLVVSLPYDKSVISTRLNIKPETFSRALSKLEPYGVEAHGREIIVHDPAVLADYCDFAWNETPC